MKQLLLKLIKLYQSTVSQVTPPSCRFLPTCSHYGYEAIDKYGILKGLFLTTNRLFRCNPLTKGGYDPVP
jgi:putative membrane protein insertion efficiency factor